MAPRRGGWGWLYGLIETRSRSGEDAAGTKFVGICRLAAALPTH